jgi:hypothetical protein
VNLVKVGTWTKQPVYVDPARVSAVWRGWSKGDPCTFVELADTRQKGVPVEESVEDVVWYLRGVK